MMMVVVVVVVVMVMMMTMMMMMMMVVVQTLLFSATLHDPIIQQLSQTIQRFPTWVDLKGKDAVPETVHHVLVRVNPKKVR